MNAQTLGIIIGRAGSKGLPGKNARPIAGRPCIVWTIEDARAATRIDRVVLSTDDERMLQIGRAMGIEAIPRPADLARDDTTVDAAVRHAAMAADPEGRCARVVILYANVPVRPPGLIDRGVALLEESGADSVQSYAPVGKHHPLWTAVVGDDGGVRPWQGDVLNAGIFRRQDLPPAHMPDAGVIVVTRRALFLEIDGVAPGPHAFFGAERRGIITGEGEVVDIDSEIDALVAEAILGRRAAGPVGARA